MPETTNNSDAKPVDKPEADARNDKTNPDNKQKKMGERLDEALEETFPSSDPVSVKITK